jgi:hypothetical protein
VACCLLKLGSLEKTVIASLFHSGLHSGTIFLWKKRCHMSFNIRERQDMSFFWKKEKKKILRCQINFLIICNFFCSKHFLIRFCFRKSMSVLDQNGKIQSLGFLARWRLTSHALYYKIPYIWGHCDNFYDGWICA